MDELRERTEKRLAELRAELEKMSVTVAMYQAAIGELDRLLNPPQEVEAEPAKE
jgi:uncharacterized protein with GYD domain